MRIQRSANCVSVQPGGQTAFSSSTASQAGLVVDAGERFADVEHFAVAIEFAVVGRLRTSCRGRILPVSMPDASGTRARMPTRRRFASAKNSSAGRWRNMLKMICTLCTFG